MFPSTTRRTSPTAKNTSKSVIPAPRHQPNVRKQPAHGTSEDTGQRPHAQQKNPRPRCPRAQAEAGADAIVVETMADLAEAELALEAAKETGLPVVACMVFDSGKQRDRTMLGVTPVQAATELTRFGADVIGANCGNGIEDYIPICASLAASTTLPIWIKP